MFEHEIRVRYAEVDLQGVAFNAHYLTWVDDAMSAWFEHVGFRGASWADDGAGVEAEDERGWDVMVRHADIDWVGSAAFGERVRITTGVARWGTTSFDVRFVLAVGGRHVATAVLTYVGTRVAPDGTVAAAPVPPRLRALLGEASP